MSRTGRWAGRSSYVVLDANFARGQRFLATWQAWRDDPARPERLHYLAVADAGLSEAELQGGPGASARAPSFSSAHSPSRPPSSRVWPLLADQPDSALADLLIAAWPPLTANLHRLVFDDGRVELLIGFGALRHWLSEFVAEVDAFFIDEASMALLQNGEASRHGPLRAFKALARLAAPLAELHVSDLAGAQAQAQAQARARASMASAMLAAGFRLSDPSALSEDAAELTAIHDPPYTPRKAPARSRSTSSVVRKRHAVIVGAGLAGCSAAWALAEQGWTSTLIDRQPGIAGETSGNRGGLFHGIVNAQDGIHARFNRAAALEAAKAVRTAVDHHGALGQVDGLLRLETTVTDVHAMQEVLASLRLPDSYVLAIDAAEASRRSGLPITQPAWWYTEGGWVDPKALARSFIERAGSTVTLRTGIRVARLSREPSSHASDTSTSEPAGRAAGQIGLDSNGNGNGNRGGNGNGNGGSDSFSAGVGVGLGVGASASATDTDAPCWLLHDDAGALIERCDVVILANAHDCVRLLDNLGDAAPDAVRIASTPGAPSGSLAGSMTSVRGQVSLLDASIGGLRAPRVPVAGAGYALPASDGLVLTGASSDEADEDTSLRPEDHAANIEQFKALTGSVFDTQTARQEGRVGWRCVTADRLPLVGAAPRAIPTPSPASSTSQGPEPARPPRLEQPRMVPREPGLYVYTGLGSRGITWCALSARLLASWVTGAPFPVEASLVDAVDPARFVSRGARR